MELSKTDKYNNIEFEIYQIGAQVKELNTKIWLLEKDTNQLIKKTTNNNDAVLIIAKDLEACINQKTEYKLLISQLNSKILHLKNDQRFIE